MQHLILFWIKDDAEFTSNVIDFFEIIRFNAATIIQVHETSTPRDIKPPPAIHATNFDTDTSPVLDFVERSEKFFGTCHTPRTREDK